MFEFLFQYSQYVGIFVDVCAPIVFVPIINVSQVTSGVTLKGSSTQISLLVLLILIFEYLSIYGTPVSMTFNLSAIQSRLIFVTPSVILGP